MAKIVLVMLNSFWGNIVTDRYFSPTSWIICSYMGLYFSQGQNYQYLFIPVVNIWKRWEYQTTWPASWEAYMQVRKQELELDMVSCFFHDPADVGNLISGSSAFSETSLNIRKFTVHILLKPGLENFEHYFTSVWDGQCQKGEVQRSEWRSHWKDYLQFAREVRSDPPPEPSERGKPCSILIPEFCFQNWQRINFYCESHNVCGHFLQQLWETTIKAK